MDSNLENDFRRASEAYAQVGVDAAAALEALSKHSVSINCWQGDDVSGFERGSAGLSGGGIMATGRYPGRARNPDELRSDMETAVSLIPGRHKVNLHAVYGEFGGAPVDRDQIEARHFEGWIDWAARYNLGLDFNATLFSHPKADAGLTLSSKSVEIRSFWIEHASRCRGIAAAIGRELRKPCIHNLWAPDGVKDFPADRFGHRALLKRSLDSVFEKKYDPAEMKDAVESKLFGLGVESFASGSHEFYLGYALTRDVMLCLDLGHFHPTESIADKISSVLQFSKELLIHVSRGVRWDSDHVPVFDDGLKEVFQEIVRSGSLTRVYTALDFFDASINRVAAWVIGARAALKCLLFALLEPSSRLAALEQAGDGAGKLALLERLKILPFGAVWDYYCAISGVPVEGRWLEKVREYEKKVLSRRK